MVLDDSVRRALQKAVEKHGNVLRFSRAIGVSHTTVLFWLKGKTSKINMTLWQSVVRPAIAEFLDEDAASAAEHSFAPVQMHEALAAYDASSAHRSPGVVGEAPLLTFDDLANLEPHMEPVEEYLAAHAARTASFPVPIAPGNFAVEVDAAHAEYFMEGSRLLVGWPDYPEEGDLVLARLRETGEILIRKYRRNPKKITLKPLLRGGKDLVVPRENRGFFLWIMPLKEAVMPLRAHKR